jgi:UDP-N-acetylmuramoyl-L-alanyl-D-glutamate--2,6-diaminopimelate ligase
VFWEPGSDWTPDRVATFQSGDVPLIRVPNLSAQVSGIAGRFYGDPSRHLQVIGVTGTNGKTSCTHFLARALAPDIRCGVIGTLGNGFPEDLEEGTHTTPDPVRLQALLSNLLARGAGAVAMEVSSHALDQYRAAAIRFHTAVLTNLSRDHLDYHETMAHYAESKKRLYRMPGLACAVLNTDDPLGIELAGELPSDQPLIGYGTREPVRYADRLKGYVRASHIMSAPSGMRIRIAGTWGTGEFRTPLLGRFNASNLLAVLAILLQRQYPLEDAMRRISRLRTVPGRMERIGGDGLPLAVIDYAHTPDALEHVLTALRDHAKGRLICVFGCGGDRDRGKRPEMGGIAESLSDRVFVTDDNPRTEDPGRIVREILDGMKRPSRAQVIHDRAAAIRTALTTAVAGDLVLVAGKGHEAVQQMGDRRIPFSDCEQVTNVLRELAS